MRSVGYYKVALLFQGLRVQCINQLCYPSRSEGSRIRTCNSSVLLQSTRFGNSTARDLHMEPYAVHTTALLETPDERVLRVSSANSLESER